MTTNTMEYLAPKDMEAQENLSLDRLLSLKAKYPYFNDETRPKASFVDLMNWVQEQFKGELKDQHGLNKFVHNRIIVDGQFLTFCDESKVSVECLYKDSLISWK